MIKYSGENMMMTEEKLEKLMSEAVDNLVNSKPKDSAECLAYIADTFAKAGMSKQSFMDLRKHIIDTAIEQTDALFVREKLEAAERELRNARTGTIILH